MEKIKLKFVYEHKWIDHPLDVNLFIDDRLIFSGIGKADELITIDKKIAIESGKHMLKLQIKGKNQMNTKVNSLNEVISDSVITIKECSMDDINLESMITLNGEFHHDQGDSLPKIKELGHNGTWELPFSVPLYNWLLEELF